MTKPSNSIPRIDEVVKFVASRIARFCDPAGFLFKNTGHLSSQDIDRLIEGFIPGDAEDSGWGDLLISHHKPEYRLWASVSIDDLSDTYCDIHGIDRWSTLWAITIVDQGWTWLYHDVAHHLPHTYMDAWTDEIVREVPAQVQYTTISARQFARHG